MSISPEIIQLPLQSETVIRLEIALPEPTDFFSSSVRIGYPPGITIELARLMKLPSIITPSRA